MSFRRRSKPSDDSPECLIRLASVPHPYPGEIWGSWLSRIALHCGQDVWRRFLRQCSFPGTKELAQPLFDMDAPAEPLLKLCSALGTTYEHAFLNLTTAPFWLTFQLSTLRNANFPNLPMARHTQRNTIKYRVEPSDEERAPKLCVDCLRADLETHGEPYWRRTHQVRAAFFCAEHSRRLISECPSCKATFTQHHRFLLAETIPLVCNCGQKTYDLDVAGRPSQYFIRLSSLVTEILDNRTFNCGYEQIKTVVHNELRRISSTGKVVDGYKKFLEEAPLTFIESADSTRKLLVADQGSSLTFPISRDAYAIDSFTSIALMAFFEWPLNHLQDSAAKSTNTPLQIKEPNHTIETLNAGLQRWKEAHPGRLPIRDPRYWRLRMRHPESLQTLFPDFELAEIPSYQDDRAVTEKLIGDETLSNSALKKLIRARAPLFERLKARDAEWYQLQLADRFSENGPLSHVDYAPPMDRYERRNFKLHDAVLLAIGTLTQNGKRPIRPTLMNIARLMKVIPRVARSAINFTELTRGPYKDANDSYNYRLAYFTAGLVYNSGVYLNIAALRQRESGLQRCPTVSKRAILDYARDHELPPDIYEHYVDVPNQWDAIKADRRRRHMPKAVPS